MIFRIILKSFEKFLNIQKKIEIFRKILKYQKNSEKIRKILKKSEKF